MKVAELIAELQQLPPDLEVVLQSDEGGFNYGASKVTVGNGEYWPWPKIGGSKTGPWVEID